MRIPCPVCGTRDRREFTWGADALALHRPDRAAGPQAWDDYIHNRENPAGATRDLWYHDACGAWAVVDRDTVSHAVHGSTLAGQVPRPDKFVWDEGDLRDVTPRPGDSA